MADEVLDWLMEGDPAIRWQTMRDLLDAPQEAWESERSTVSSHGWGKRFLELQDPEGTWAQGIYGPKWTSTTYTLLTLIDFGIDGRHPAVRRGANQVFEKGIAQYRQKGRLGNLLRNDVCVWGFYLLISVHFGITEPVIEELIELLLEEQMPDGGWNCRRQRDKSTRHGSFHTTFNVLEGLRAATRIGLLDRGVFQESEAKAMNVKAEAYQEYNQAAVIDKLFTSLPEIVRALASPLANVDKITVVSTGNGDAAGLNKITGDITKMAAQVPALFETLSGMSMTDLLSKVRVIGDKSAGDKTVTDKPAKPEVLPPAPNPAQ